MMEERALMPDRYTMRQLSSGDLNAMEEHRRRGIATGLIQQLERIAAARGPASMNPPTTRKGKTMAKASARRKLDPQVATDLLQALEARFSENPHRHPDQSWGEVLARLERHPERLWSLGELERTGGEPDIVGRDEASGEFLFVDCAPESPAGRRSLCYDEEALEARRKNKPKGSAMKAATDMGAELLTEREYFRLQEFGIVDSKTSSWLQTPAEVRRLGGALFGDHRFGRVFVYHNGADSYYAARGFRCVLRV